LRQLALTPQERNGLFAVLLASAVSVAASAVYQAAVEVPRMREEFKNPQKLAQAMAQEGLNFDQAAVLRRIEDGHVWGTFSHPNSLAGYLALLLPGLAGAAWLVRRGPPWRKAAAAG